jgi:hypothetical protein
MKETSMDEVIRYHVFIVDSNKDDWYASDELEKAVKQYQKHVDSGEQHVRLYKDSYPNEEDYENDANCEEYVLLSTGY